MAARRGARGEDCRRARSGSLRRLRRENAAGVCGSRPESELRLPSADDDTDIVRRRRTSTPTFPAVGRGPTVVGQGELRFH